MFRSKSFRQLTLATFLGAAATMVHAQQAATNIASDRWVTNTVGTRYFRRGSYVLANLRVDYELTDRIDLGVGGPNLLDDNFQLADGFPEPGRSFFASMRARY